MKSQGWLERLGIEQSGESSLEPHSYSISPLSIWLTIALVGTLVINHLFFNQGSLNYDLRTGTIWVYILSRHGISALYHLPLAVSVPDAWGGVPMQEAAFPYGPAMAYIFLGISWIYRLFYAPPFPMPPDPLQIAYVIRQFNAIFGLLSAILIYKILQEQRVLLKARLVSASLFLFNPAVWFVGSVWGQTQNVSLFFLLLAIWLGEKGRLTLAWTFILLTSMTRPQMLIPSFLLALFFLRKFRISMNIRSLSWSIILIFLVLAPFSLTESPTLPVDIYVHTFSFHLAGQNDRWSNPVSWSALSLWTLAAGAVGNSSGLDRITRSAMELQIGPFSYWQLGNYSYAFLVAASAVAVLTRPRRYVLALAISTLGLFLLKTSFAAFHLIPALALVILSRGASRSWVHFAVVGILTITTFLAMYSMAAVWMTPHPSWGVGIFDPANPVTSSIKGLMNADWFISGGSLLNLIALLILGREVMRR